VSQAQFIGRALELQRITAVLAGAAQSRGSLVVVSGEAGIGKSRLCRELADTAQRMDFEVTTARCWVEGGAPPLWPWQPLLADLCGADAAELLAGDAGHADIDPDRFARFEAVRRRLAEACAQSPVCVIIDDIHAADVGTLLLTRFVARSLQRLPLVLVLSRRTVALDADADADAHRARQLAEIEAEGTSLILGPLDQEETTAFLAAHGLTRLDHGLVDALHRVTTGNPLFLSRVTALRGSVQPDALGGGVRAAIGQAIEGLGDATQHVLRASAVLGENPSIGDAAVVSQREPLAVLDAVHEAATAGLVAPLPSPTADRFSFTHELVRSALEDGLVVSDRLDAHARAAVAAAGDEPVTRPDRLARRAHHALAAAPRSVADARLAVAACHHAAQAMVRSFAYEQADSLLSAAVDLHRPSTLGPPPAELLVAWAQAALHCGRMRDARQRFAQAAAAAEHENAPVLHAEAALGLGGHWVNEHRAPVERSRVLGLQRAALERLPDEQVSLRCRLRARLAAEAVFDGAPIEPVLEALDAARDCGDAAALAEALSLSYHALFTPRYRSDRRGLADELVRVASEAGQGVLGLMGLCWRTVDLFQVGDSAALRALEDLRERATTLACQNILYIVGVMDVMLLIRQGRLDDAEKLAQHCYELGEAVGEVDTVAYLSAQLLAIRWLQGRDAELADVAEEIASSPTLVRGEFAFRAVGALLAIRAGRPERARAMLEALTVDGLAALPQTSNWMVGILAIAETAAVLGLPALAREAYDLLSPYGSLPTVGSVGVVCLGSTERGLGIAALGFGDVDRAIAHLERSVGANLRLGNRPVTVVSRADLAAALQHRATPRDLERAEELLRAAIDEGELMGMTARVGEWRNNLATLLDTSRAPAADGSDTAPPSPRDRRSRNGVVVRGDSWWALTVDGHEARVPDLVGMRYLTEMLTHPGEAIPALALASHGALVNESPRHELLDDAARADYVRRARALADEVAEAEAAHDLALAERLRFELDALADELMGSTAPDGRSRSFVDDAERARTAVRKAIKRALDAVAGADPLLAAQLADTVSTGARCIYLPDVQNPVIWTTRRATISATDTT
jgi:tetratricopeptide (TPR) repeat protein